MSNHLSRPLKVFVASLLALVVAEIALQIATRPEQFLDPAEEEFWRVRLQGKLDRGEEASASRDTVYDATLGWRMRPGLVDNGISHNSKGYRGGREFGRKVAPRIVGIGDSFTYGLGVDDASTYLAVLERALGIETVNAGVNGFGVDQALLLWETEGRELQPDIVVLGYFAEDFHRHVAKVRERPKPYFRRNPSGTFEVAGVPVPDLDDAYFTDVAKFRLRLVDATSRIYRRAMRRVSGLEGDYCRETNAACVNLASAMRAVAGHRFYSHTCHYSDEGNRFAGELIADLIKQRNMMP